MIISDDELRWAWRKRHEGHALFQVAEALNISHRTLDRYFRQFYGTTRPSCVYPIKRCVKPYVPLETACEAVCKACNALECDKPCSIIMELYKEQRKVDEYDV